MIVARDCDRLRRLARSTFKNWGLFTISSMRARPSAEIRVVEVQKLRTFYDFCGARATLCGDSRGRGSKTQDFLRFLLAARDPLRRFAWSRFKNSGLFTISAGRARPSAEIRVVEVQKLRTLYDVCWPCATLCGDSRGRGSKTEDFFTISAGEFVLVSANPLRRLCMSKRSRCGAVQYSCSRNGLWKLSRGLRACFRDPAVAGSIPPWSVGSSGLKIAAFKYKRSTRRALLQLRLENRNF